MRVVREDRLPALREGAGDDPVVRPRGLVPAFERGRRGRGRRRAPPPRVRGSPAGSGFAASGTSTRSSAVNGDVRNRRTETGLARRRSTATFRFQVVERSSHMMRRTRRESAGVNLRGATRSRANSSPHRPARESRNALMPVRERLHVRPLVRGQERDGRLRDAGEAVDPVLAVRGKGGAAEDLRELAARQPALELHLEEALARRQVPLNAKRVLDAGRRDRRDAAVVERDGHVSRGARGSSGTRGPEDSGRRERRAWRPRAGRRRPRPPRFPRRRASRVDRGGSGIRQPAAPVSGLLLRGGRLRERLDPHLLDPALLSDIPIR